LKKRDGIVPIAAVSNSNAAALLRQIEIGVAPIRHRDREVVQPDILIPAAVSTKASRGGG